MTSTFPCEVMAHNPRTFPEVSSQGTILDTGKEAFFAVSATYTESRYYLLSSQYVQNFILTPGPRQV